MVASVVRGIGSVLTVLVAILVTTNVGGTATGKVLAATISAAVLIGLEWFVRWSPQHLQWARRHLDERATWIGIWVQRITDTRSTSGRVEDSRNDFSVFRITYQDGYHLFGRAFDHDGNLVALWRSTEDATFSKDGRRMSYVWQGSTTELGEFDPQRTGLATMMLNPGEADNGTGQVQHVDINRRLDFELERVTEHYLRNKRLDESFPLAALDGDDARRDFGKALAEAWKAAGQSPTTTSTSNPSEFSR